MHYVSDGKRYEGFTSATLQPTVVASGEFLVIVWFDGEPDLWKVQNQKGLDELKLYYLENWQTDRVTFQAFSPVTI